MSSTLTLSATMSDDTFPRIESSSLEGRALSIRFRERLFHSLYSTVKASQAIIKDAITADFGCSEHEATLEYALAVSELRLHYDSLDLKADVKRAHSLEDLEGSTGVGIVYVIPSKQNLFYSVVSALAAALAAGNCVILELPSTLMQLSGLLRKLLPSALDLDAFAISDKRPSADFLLRCFVVSQSENRQGIPQGIVERGLQSRPAGKVVAVVDRTANIAEAALIIGTARLSFQGQSAYAPDVVFVNEFIAEDFLSYLVQTVAAPFSNRHPSQRESATSVSKAQSDADAHTVREFEKKESTTVIVSGANGSIVEIKDRSKVSLDRKTRGRVIIVSRISSLDDAIDYSSNLGSPFEASYVFGAPAEANYVSKYLEARISCINHIPVEFLVGPSAPVHATIPPTTSPRYTPAMFRTPRPRVTHTTAVTDVFQEMIRSRSTKAFDSWTRSVLDNPLPAINQGDGKVMGFFEQSLIVLAAAVVPVLVGGGYLVFRLRSPR